MVSLRINPYSGIIFNGLLCNITKYRRLFSKHTKDISTKILTIEHVLPQTVNDDSQWGEWWPNPDERSQWVHKIDNLLPLAKRTNSQAQNYDLDMKKEEYFGGKASVAAYALMTQILMCPEWKRETVKARQDELIKVYRKNWDL